MQIKSIGIAFSALCTLLLMSCSGGGGSSAPAAPPANPYDGTWNLVSYTPAMFNVEMPYWTCTTTAMPATLIISNGTGTFSIVEACAANAGSPYLGRNIPMTVNVNISSAGIIQDINSFNLLTWSNYCLNTKTCSLAGSEQLLISR